MLLGTGCVVKGSYCQCHYCKCEKGQLHCSKKGFGSHKGFGKRYCYGSMEGEYCHCDYCRSGSGVKFTFIVFLITKRVLGASMDMDYLDIQVVLCVPINWQTKDVVSNKGKLNSKFWTWSIDFEKALIWPHSYPLSKFINQHFCVTHIKVIIHTNSIKNLLV